MAEILNENAQKQLVLDELNDIKKLLWGPIITPEIFERWDQGFEFSENEPIALVQRDGGPCAVIASVQAFLLKSILFTSKNKNPQWRQLDDNEKLTHLANALFDVIIQVGKNGESFKIVQLQIPNEYTGERINSDVFHSHLQVINCSAKETCDVIHNSIAEYLCQFGVLLHLYTVLLNKGYNEIKREMEDTSEVLIDPTHGHGSQCLLNLFLTGYAVTNLWDGERDVCGLKLQGISKRSPIGFLTQLEHLRYTEVGWNLKNPLYPIWVLGSETHLTVLFSLDDSLVTHESSAQLARKAFACFDTEKNGFITMDKFTDLLKSLNLQSDPEYVNMMKNRVDEEGLGIVMLSKFMHEFFPNEEKEQTITKFILYHVNSLARLSTVEFLQGQAEICDLPDMQVIGDTSPIRTCLMTKWPTIELKWNKNKIPSLN